MTGMKSLSQKKENILKILWEVETPVKLNEISEKTGSKIRSAYMHLVGLRKAGYVSLSEGAYYTLTESGKEMIGFPKVDENLAKRVLSKTSPEKSFHFYAGIGQPSGVSSNNLIDLCEKIKLFDIRSVEFHAARGDFETWIHSFGDIELAMRMGRIREANLAGDVLRKRLYETIRSRCDELLKKVA
jgi:hypothetical protein